MKYSVKFALLGHQAVGKTSIILRYTKNMYPKRYLPSIGADFFVKEMPEMIIYLWDIAGQKLFEPMVPSFIRGTLIGIIVFDISRQETFDAVDYWIYKLKKYGIKDAGFVLVGNKKDLEENRQVASNEARKFAEMRGAIDYIETSAVYSIGITDLFDICMNEAKRYIKNKKVQGE